ncbi:unnamed protein product [Caenorhabditis bovis]|uniref:L-aminoadipate-semialdehyde dehydrogenase-phosphopantetheinyl transferase n=1 Tax=Caenorhabditis bovis TaxID=2654633 RepID=A0A8S1E6N5_9PELO|nr:unnamed protein product [Caenorhabditis bovis]
MCVTEEDVKQQRSFMYRQDALACLIGRLLSRKAAVECLKIPWEDIEFGRTNRGKPFVKNESVKSIPYNFNVSHQGDIVILGCSPYPIGVDVMEINQNRSKTAAELIDTFKRQFTTQEVIVMRSKPTELERWRGFYRIWCLKEAILKATGIGLTRDLRKFDFVVNEELKPGDFVTNSQYYYDSELQTDWILEESFVNEDHCAAVAMYYE